MTESIHQEECDGPSVQMPERIRTPTSLALRKYPTPDTIRTLRTEMQNVP